MAGVLAGVHTFTVLFTDVVASTATRARLGEEAFDLLRAEHDDLTLATIATLNGTMVKHTGDGVMALFVGAGDALACATRLHQLLERRNRTAKEKIEIRAGLSMGDVVIENDDVQGIAVVEARRLCDAAGTGHVLCSDLVRAASGTRGGHRFGPVTERELKGLGAPLMSCELVWSDGEGGEEPPRFRVFGPLAVERDGHDLPLGGPKERAVLAALVAGEGAPVSTDALAEAVWGDSPPRSARRTIQAYVARLRATVGTQPGGEPWLTGHGSAYVLEVDRENVDAQRFTDLAAGARGLLERGDPGAAVTAFDDALALWRATPYDGFEDIERCAAATRSLEELRSNVIEDRFDALLALGQSSELVPELEGVLSSEPFRERLWGQLMVALYRSGRQADALRAYQRARRVLAEDLGIEPGPALRDLEEAILVQDDHRLRRTSGGEPIVALPAALDVAGAALVGRDEELARLRAAWDGARNQSSGYVAVVGPEGIGKTRLVSALAAEAHAAGAVTCYARCDAAHRSARALFDQALRSAGTSLLQAQSAALPGESLGTGLARSLAAWSTRAPILLVLDDLHAADDEVLEVVAEIPSAAAGAALLVVAIFRTEPDDSATRSAGGQQIMLGGIDRAAVAELCALYGDAWSTAELDRLHADTYGIPIAVHEEAAAWARVAADRRRDDAADQAQLAEHRLLLSQQAVADEVVGIQHLVEQRRRQLPAVGASPRPFKGLFAFDVDDAPWFFGRERLVAELAARLATRPVLAIVGASGSGKSSLVRAGLLPALAAGSLPGSEQWRVVVTTPGATPRADLDRALEAAAGDGPRVLLVVDQLEELFTHCDDPAEREEFGQDLQRLVDDGAGVVTTLRADQMGSLSEVPSLARLLRGNDVLVGPIRDRELRDVIERPAQRAGLQLEQGLVEQIIADAQGSSGVLPLLQTALLTTWERRTGNVLTRGAYQESGGVQGAVARLAETTFAGLTPGQQDAARRILLRLAEASEDGTLDLRRRVRVDDIASHDDAEARVAYEEMVRHRLLISTQDTVEVSHEALLREWPRLREWLQDDVEGRRLHQRLGDSARAWAVGDRDESELLRGTRLSATLDWAVTHPDDLNDVELELLDASRGLAGREVTEANQRADREALTSNRLRRLLAGVAVLLVLALGAGALALVQRQEAFDSADDATNAERAAQIEALVGRAESLRGTQRDTAALLAIEAHRMADTARTRSSLFGTFTNEERFLDAHRFPGDRGTSGIVMPDGASAYLTDDAGRLRPYDLDTGALGEALPVIGDGERFPVLAASPDGGRIAMASRSDPRFGPTTVGVVDLATGSLAFDPMNVDGSVTSAVFLPDGHLALAIGEDGRLVVVDAGSGATVITIDGVAIPEDDGATWRFESALLRPSSVALAGEELLVGAGDGTLRILDAATLQLRRTLKLHAQTLSSVRVLGDGTAVTSGRLGTTRIDLTTGKTEWSIPDLWRCTNLLVIEQAGVLFCGDLYGRLEERDLMTGIVIRQLGAQNGNSGSLWSAAGGTELVSFGNNEPVVSRWRLDRSGPITRVVAPGWTQTDFNHTGDFLLFEEGDVFDEADTYRARLLDTADGTLMPPFDNPWIPSWADADTLFGVSHDGPVAVEGCVCEFTNAEVGSDGHVGAPAADGAVPYHPDWIREVAIDTGKDQMLIRYEDEEHNNSLARLDPRSLKYGPRISVEGLATQAISRTGDRIVAGTSNGIVVFDGRTGEEVGALTDTELRGVVLTVTDQLFVSSIGGELTLYDLETLEPIRTFGGSRGLVTGGAGTADGSLVAMTGGDKQVSLFDVATGLRIGEPITVPDLALGEVSLSLDGRWLATGGEPIRLDEAMPTDRDEPTQLWDLDPAHWVSAACGIAGRNLTRGEWATHIGDLSLYRPTCPQFPSG